MATNENEFVWLREVLPFYLFKLWQKEAFHKDNRPSWNIERDVSDRKDKQLKVRSLFCHDPDAVPNRP
jgi:hypothetical protein